MALPRSILVPAILAGFAAISYLYLARVNLFRELVYTDNKTCVPIGIEWKGAEDIAVDRDTGILFISSDDHKARSVDEKYGRGRLYTYAIEPHSASSDPKKRISEPALLDLPTDYALSPHGISFLKHTDGKKYLFVVNHLANNSDAVDVFDVELKSSFANPKTSSSYALRFRERFQGGSIIHLNDVYGVGPRSFYATNDFNSRNKVFNLLGELSTLGTSSVIHFEDGKDRGKVADGLFYPNGVAYDANRDVLLVAASLGKTLHAYQPLKDGERNSLYPELWRKDLNSIVDNIDIDEAGDIWIGAHPKALHFLRYMILDRSKPSPSEAIRVSWNPSAKDKGARKPSDAGEVTFETVLLDSGKTIPASSTALRYKSHLLMSTVADDVFHCQL